MIDRAEILSTPEYWFQDAQLAFYEQVNDYLESEKTTKTELAKRLNVSKGRVSQILNGEYNYSLKKLIEICLSIGLVPQINYTNLVDVIKQDSEKTTEIQSENKMSGFRSMKLLSQDPSIPLWRHQGQSVDYEIANTPQIKLSVA